MTVAPLWRRALFLALAARSLLPAVLTQGLVLTLFLIGARLSRATLRSVGTRPLVQGVLLWLAVAGVSLAAVPTWTS